jgi:hypothetical protein
VYHHPPEPAASNNETAKFKGPQEVQRIGLPQSETQKANENLTTNRRIVKPIRNKIELQNKSRKNKSVAATCRITTGKLTKPCLYLINPSNPQVSMINTGESRWNRHRVWQPLGLMFVAGLTPEDWEVTVIDENRGVPDYASMPIPNLVGVTAFTSQTDRAYSLATHFRNNGVPVVIGGIHVSMCREKALGCADTVVIGEAEGVWLQVLADSLSGH